MRKANLKENKTQHPGIQQKNLSFNIGGFWKENMQFSALDSLHNSSRNDVVEMLKRLMQDQDFRVHHLAQQVPWRIHNELKT